MPSNTSSNNFPGPFVQDEINAKPYANAIVAIVILNWNGRKYLEQFLPSVLATTYENKKIVVADNASTDDSVNFLKAHYPSIELIHNGGNLGFAKGYNTALKEVEADYFILLNSDVQVMPGWVEPIIELMDADRSIGACQPKILSYHHPAQFEYAGACGGWIDKLGYPFARGRVFDYCETDEGQYDEIAPCFWATGASLFVRAAVYKELQGLDEFFFAHQEEIDLCWRMQMRGHKVFVHPQSIVYHVGGGTLPQGNNLKTFLNFRNNLIMLYKNTPRPDAYFLIPFRMLLDAVAAWKALLGGDPGYFLSLAKAHLKFMQWILFQQGESIFPVQRRVVSAGFFEGSVVWQYFIKKKKTFQEIVGNK